MDTADRPARPGRILIDVCLGLVFAAGLVFTASAISASWGGSAWVLDAVAGTAVAVLALVRERNRLVTAAAGLAVAAVAIAVSAAADLPREPGPVASLALAVLTVSAVRRLPPWQVCAVAAAGAAVVAAGQLAARPASTAVAGVAVFFAVTWLGAVVVGAVLRALDARARSTAERVRRAERLDLARELHDVVAHHITGMLVQAQAAQVVARRTPEKVPQTLAGIEAAGADALAAMRRAVGLLRDTADAAPSSPGPERLEELVERFARQGTPVELTLPDDASWPPEVATTLYRIVQEALTNVARHAPQARSVAVAVGRDERSVAVEVVDDAPPPARPHGRGGYGLVGMRERVEMLGGTLAAGPGPGGGWSVAAVLPLAPKEPR
ncbi:sensor histidine kinase [Actinocorallia populi]|uniref:sensor histidine kinase n=1 Tax=Actinocorallia populi TaxID=2079200 RepID=UPI000D093ABA|nr:histidine kinase [Actinocorallia populi]